MAVTAGMAAREAPEDREAPAGPAVMVVQEGLVVQAVTVVREGLVARAVPAARRYYAKTSHRH
jgi:hypothetical protein